MIVGAGWWVAIAQLTPAADRPYFGGSTDNNILELALGYNGLGRLDGSETGSIGGGGGGGSSFGGATGVFRLFQSEFGGQVSWLIPAALISLGALLWISRRAPRTSRVRSFALLWGGWLLVTGVVFSYMQGIIHPYYMVALAPAIGALVGVGAISLLQSGLTAVGRAVAAVGVLVTGIWAYELLERTPEWLPWLRWTVLLAGVLGAISIFAVPELLRRTDRNRVTAGGRRRAPALVYAPMALAIVAGLGGPLAYSLDTANTTHTGSIPSAGPTVAGSFGGGRGWCARWRRRLQGRLRRQDGRGNRGSGHRNERRNGHRADRDRRAPLPAPAARRPEPAGTHPAGSPAPRAPRALGPAGPGGEPRAPAASAAAAWRWAAFPAAPRSAAR